MFLWVYTTDWLTWVNQIVYWQVLDYYWLLDFVRNFSIINCSAWFTDCRLRFCSAFHNNQQVAQNERLPVYIKYCVIMYACGTEGSSWKKKDEPNLQNIKVRTFLVRVWVVGGGRFCRWCFCRWCFCRWKHASAGGCFSQWCFFFAFSTVCSSTSVVLSSRGNISQCLWQTHQ